MLVAITKDGRNNKKRETVKVTLLLISRGKYITALKTS
jgi:hypothetical protein